MRHAILLALILVGCRQQGSPLSNPFLAPDRVPAPATRTPPPGAALPYYDGAAPPAASPDAWQSSQSEQQPSGNDAVTRMAAQAQIPQSAEGDRHVQVAGHREQIAIPGDDRRERLVQRASVAASSTSGTRKAPRPFPDIADLPEVDSAKPRREEQQPGSGQRAADRSAGDAFRPRNDPSQFEQSGAVQTASFEAPLPTFAPRTATPPRPTAITSRSTERHRYGNAPDYAWLQGRLEHSQAEDQWKLRYIPVDGETDQYGGSVVLENPDALGDLGAGDFVRVEGSLLETEQDALSFAPMYRIGRIQPLAD